jgi:hypothetical protein
MAIITEGTLESPLALESLIESPLESYASGKVEFSMGSFRPMENSEFLETLANRRL